MAASRVDALAVLGSFRARFIRALEHGGTSPELAVEACADLDKAMISASNLAAAALLAGAGLSIAADQLQAHSPDLALLVRDRARFVQGALATFGGAA